MTGESTTTARPAASHSVMVWAFSVLSACLSAGYGVLFTLVGDYRETYGISELAIGWIIGVGFIVAFVAQVLIAPLGDRGHARTLVLAGVAVNAVGLLLMGVGTDAGTLTIGRVVSGLAIGAANPAIRRIVVLGDPDNVGRNLGRLFSADVAGFALGPALSAILVGPFGLAAPFVVIAALSTLVLLVTVRVRVPEGKAEDQRQRFAVDLLRSRTFAGAVLLGSTTFVMIGAFDALWDVVHVDLGTPTWLANLGITLFAIPLVIFGPIGGKLAQNVGPFRVGAIGLTVGAFFMALYGVLPTGVMIVSFALFHAVGDGLTFASTGVAVALTAPEERQAGAQGVLGAGQALAAGIMAVTTGALYQWGGRAVAYGTAAAIMMVLIAVSMVLAADTWRSSGWQRGVMADRAGDGDDEGVGGSTPGVGVG
ncbi:MAG: MFS transporter [Actinomycetota bacterium]